MIICNYINVKTNYLCLIRKHKILVEHLNLRISQYFCISVQFPKPPLEVEKI